MKKIETKISIIMGVYNCADTLDESIKSIIDQTFKNWELIICNDASTDNTMDVLDYYKRIDNRIKVISNKYNRGLAYSLNKCIEIATGEYIARHDGDDICLPNRLEKQIDFIINNNFDFIGCGVEYFDNNGTWGEDILKEKLNTNDIFYRSMFSHPTLLIKKDVINKVNNYTVSKITLRAEDYDLFAKLYSLGFRGYNIQEILLRVRRDSNAYKRRKFKYRIDECRCKFKAWKMLNMNVKYLYVVVLPFIKGLVPTQLVKKYHSLKFSK